MQKYINQLIQSFKKAEENPTVESDFSDNYPAFEKQNELGWGKSVVKDLSNDLQSEFVGVQGCSVQNLWNMRKFYLEYEDNEKLQPMVGEIGWTDNRENENLKLLDINL